MKYNIEFDSTAKTITINKDGEVVPFMDMSVNCYHYCDCNGVKQKRVCIYFRDEVEPGVWTTYTLEFIMSADGQLYASKFEEVPHEELEKVIASLQRTKSSIDLSKVLAFKRRGGAKIDIQANK